MLTKNAMGNLINRYKAVLKKCRLLNVFGSLIVASMLTASVAHVALAVDLGADHDLTIGTAGDLQAGDDLSTNNTSSGDYTLNIQNDMTGANKLGDFTIGTGPDNDQAGDITVSLEAGDGSKIETGSLTIQSGQEGSYATRNSTYTISSGTVHIVNGNVYITSGNDYSFDSGAATLNIADGGTLLLQNTNNFINNDNGIASKSLLNVQGNLHSFNAAGTAAADLSLEGINTTFAENSELIATGLTLAEDNLDGSLVNFNQDLITVDADYTGTTPLANTIQSLTIEGGSEAAFRGLHADGNINLGITLRDVYGNLDVFREYTDTANAVIDINANSVAKLETSPGFTPQGAYDVDSDGVYDTILSFSNLTIDPAQILNGSTTPQAGQIALNNNSELKANTLHLYKAGTNNHTLSANTAGTHENFLSAALLNVLGEDGYADGSLTVLSPLTIIGTGNVGNTALNAATITAGTATTTEAGIEFGAVTFKSRSFAAINDPRAGGGLINANLQGNDNASYFSVKDGTWRMDDDNALDLSSAGLHIADGLFHDNDRTLSANAFIDGSTVPPAPTAGQIALAASPSGQSAPMYYANNLTLQADGEQTLNIGSYKSSPAPLYNGTIGAEYLSIVNTADSEADNLTITGGSVLVSKGLTADKVTLADDGDAITASGLILGSDYALSGGTLDAAVQVQGANAMLVQRGSWEALKDIDIENGTLTVSNGATLDTSATTLSVDASTGKIALEVHSELIVNQSDLGYVTEGGTIGDNSITLNGRLTIANGWDGTNAPISMATLKSNINDIASRYIEGSLNTSIYSGGTAGMKGVVRLEDLNVSTEGLTLADANFNFSLPDNTLGAGRLGDANGGNAYHVEVQGLRGNALSTVDSTSKLALLGGNPDTVLAEGDIQLNDDVDIAGGSSASTLSLGTGTMAQHNVILGSAIGTSLVNTGLYIMGNTTVGNIVQGDGNRAIDGDVEGVLAMAKGASLTVLGNVDVQSVNIENTSTNTLANIHVEGDLTVGDAAATSSGEGKITTSGNTTVMGEMKLHMWGSDSQTPVIFDELKGTTTVGSLVLSPEKEELNKVGQILQILGTTTVTTGGINGDAEDLNATGGLNANGLILVGNMGEQAVVNVQGDGQSEAGASDLADLTFFASSKWNPTEIGTSWIADAYTASTIHFADGFEDNSGTSPKDNVMRGTLAMGQNSVLSTGHIDDNISVPLMLVELGQLNPQWYGDYDLDGSVDSNAITWGTDYYDANNANNISAALYINNPQGNAAASIDLNAASGTQHGTVLVDGSLLRVNGNAIQFYNTDEDNRALYQIVDLGSATEPNNVERGSAIFGYNSLLMVDANGVRNDLAPGAHESQNNGSSTFLAGPGELRIADTSRLHIREGYAGQELHINMAKGDGSFWQGLGYNAANPQATQITTDTALLKVNHAAHSDPGITGSNGSYTLTLQQVPAKEVFPLFSDTSAEQIDQFMRESGLNYDGGTALQQYLSRALSYNYGLGATKPEETVRAIEDAKQSSAMGGVNIATLNVGMASSAATIARNVMGSYANGGQAMGSVNVAENGEISTGIPAGDSPDLTEGIQNGLGLWLMPMYKWSKVEGQGDASQHSYDTGLTGLNLGIDYSFNEMFRLGLSVNLGAGQTESFGYTNTNNDFDFFGVGLYAAYRNGGFGLIGDVGYTQVSNEVNQSISSALALGSNSVEVDSDLFMAGLTAEYVIQSDIVDIIPHVGARFMSVSVPGHTIMNNGPMFEVEDDTQNLWYFPLGIAFQKDIDMDDHSGWHFTPKLDLGVIFAAGDLEANSKVTAIGLAGTSAFEMQNVDDIAFNGGIGLDFGNENMSFGVNYNLLASEHETGHMVFGTFRLEF